MSGRRLDHALSRLERMLADRRAEAFSDRALLEGFVTRHDEAAFAALVERHGAMVLNVCRRVLHHRQDAEDACQATFLVFARKASGIHKRTAVASWLHGVAYRVATNLKRHRDRRRGQAVADVPQPDTTAEVTWREVQAVLDEELARLPERLRTPLILCYLEGKTRDEAAQRLGWSVSTLRGRLERARKLLRSRLTRRGLTPPAVLAAAVLTQNTTTAALPAPLAALVVEAGLLAACGQTVTPSVVAPEVMALAERTVRTMLWGKLRIAAVLVLAVGFLGTGALFLRRPAVEAAETPAPEVVQAEGPKREQSSEGTAAAVVLLEILRNEPYPLSDAAFAKFKEAQAEFLVSRHTLITVVERASIRELEIIKKQKAPVDWLADHLKVDFPKDGDVLRLSLQGHEGKEAAAIVNAIADAYLLEAGGEDYERLCNRLAESQRRHQTYLDLTRIRQRDLADLASSRGVKGSPMSQIQQQYLLGQLTDAARELRRVKLSRAAAEFRLDRVKAEKERPNLAAERKQLEEELGILAAQEKLLKQEQEELLRQEAEQGRLAGELDMVREEIKRHQAQAAKAAEEMESLRLQITEVQPRVRRLPASGKAKPK